MTNAEPILELAKMVASAVIERLVADGKVTAPILQRLQSSPTQRAFAAALARAIDGFRRLYPHWYANLFDGSFLRKQALATVTLPLHTSQRGRKSGAHLALSECTAVDELTMSP